MTLSEQMRAARDRQATFRLDAEVRALAKARCLDVEETDALVGKARRAFIFVSGVPRAVHENKVPMRRDDGALLTVEEWVDQVRSAECRMQHDGPVGAFGLLPVKNKNPWRSESWNLTEQMRILRRDPELAAKLREQA